MILGFLCFGHVRVIKNSPESPPKVNFKVISISQTYLSSFNALNKVLVF